ncbi:hydrogenase 4 subunit B [Phenylobacterium montanum]|uniref:Hydrogenase 4 subunit B n=1 Tax=Phenylobacterium montanum TaxID=2823693 RepID=A0A975G445_9CAUL|nr:hydrogenase 4 subunit B [Caulobacter sp. S6]QUD89666.1 hydrogenase 4 subunit B [Caulobacter sp. S6]
MPPAGTTTVLACVAALIALGVGSAPFGRRQATSPVVYGASAIFCLVAGAAALGALLARAAPDQAILPLGLPWTGARFRLDPLSAAFLIVIDLGGALASLYAVGYGAHEREPQRILPFFPVFLGAMNLVVLAADAFSFLVAWEVMSVTSWALVLAHHQDAENRRAAHLYLVMASFGAFCLLLGFGLLAGPGGGYAFDTMRAHPPGALIAGLVLVLAVLGAGSKAGLVPLHAWLPLAHPAAPSHVSALMSGVMTKVAIYAFVRIAFDLLGPPQDWWSVLVLVLGAATAVMGVLYALMQTDMKRLLAYSTVENVGIIFIGLGLALAFKAQGLVVPAALAATAALFHAFNHSLFKSLLFMGAGAVLGATGQRDLERLGGLIGRMPQTALVFLTGSVAISALPPLNGFASEWLIFQGVLVSPQLAVTALKFLVPAAGAMLALAAALTAAAMVRCFGTAFLGRPRSPQAAAARETDPWSLGAMFALAALCLVVGVLPGFVIDALAPAAALIVGGHMPDQVSQPWLSIVPIAESRSSYNGLLVLVFIAASAGLAALAIHRYASGKVRRAPAWDCGFPDPSPLTQYSAGSFAQPIRRVFGPAAFAAREIVEMPPPGDMRPARFIAVVRDRIWETLYAPIDLVIGRIADRLNRLQFLTIRLYLGLVFLALVGLLLVLAIWV